MWILEWWTVQDQDSSRTWKLLKTALEQPELDKSQEKPIRNIAGIKKIYRQLGILQEDGTLVESQLAMPNSQKQIPSKNWASPKSSPVEERWTSVISGGRTRSGRAADASLPDNCPYGTYPSITGGWRCILIALIYAYTYRNGLTHML